MAINWGGGLSGAASGAALGAPFAGATGGLSIAAGAALGGAVGLFGGSGDDMQQVNPYAGRYWDLMTGNLNNYQKQMSRSEGLQTGYLGASARGFNQLNNFTPSATYDSQAAVRALNAQMPYMQQQAQGMMSPFGDTQGTAAERATRVGQSIAAQYNQGGALGSGAAQAAIAEGASRAAGEIDLSADQQYQAVIANMMNQRAQALQAAYQTELQRQMAIDQLNQQNLAASSQGYSNIGSQYGQRATTYANLVGQTQGGLASMAGQEYTYQPSQNLPLQGLQTAAGVVNQMDSAGSFNWGSPTQQAQQTQNPPVVNNQSYSMFGNTTIPSDPWSTLQYGGY